MISVVVTPNPRAEYLSTKWIPSIPALVACWVPFPMSSGSSGRVCMVLPLKIQWIPVAIVDLMNKQMLKQQSSIFLPCTASLLNLVHIWQCRFTVAPFLSATRLFWIHGAPIYAPDGALQLSLHSKGGWLREKSSSWLVYSLKRWISISSVKSMSTIYTEVKIIY